MLNQVLAELSQPCNEPEVMFLRQVCLCNRSSADLPCRACTHFSALHCRALEKSIFAMWVSTVVASF